MRRVVVTGLGAITPLGVGVRPTWRRLLASESGLVSVAARVSPAEQPRWCGLTSTVAGLVPTSSSSSSSPPPPQSSSALGDDDAAGEADSGSSVWRPSDWLDPADQRRMSTFAQYAVAAAEMALRDAGWAPDGPAEREMTGVCLGSGIGNLDDVYATSVAFERDVGCLFFSFFLFLLFCSLEFIHSSSSR